MEAGGGEGGVSSGTFCATFATREGSVGGGGGVDSEEDRATTVFRKKTKNKRIITGKCHH